MRVDKKFVWSSVGYAHVSDFHSPLLDANYVGCAAAFGGKKAVYWIYLFQRASEASRSCRGVRMTGVCVVHFDGSFASHLGLGRIFCKDTAALRSVSCVTGGVA